MSLLYLGTSLCLAPSLKAASSRPSCMASSVQLGLRSTTSIALPGFSCRIESSLYKDQAPGGSPSIIATLGVLSVRREDARGVIVSKIARGACSKNHHEQQQQQHCSRAQPEEGPYNGCGLKPNEGMRDVAPPVTVLPLLITVITLPGYQGHPDPTKDRHQGHRRADTSASVLRSTAR